MTNEPETATITEPQTSSPWPRRLAVTLIFAVATMAMIRRTPWQLSHRMIGNLGDPALAVWILRWVGHALVHNPGSVFNANIFWPTRDTLAYSDDLLAVAPIYNLLYALTHSWMLSLNLLWLAEIGLNLGATYSLTRWLTGSTEAGIFAGLACGFSAFVLSQTGHPALQLVGLLPLGFLLLFKLLERPRLATAVALGLVDVVILTTVLYWAAIYAVSVVVIVAGFALSKRRTLSRPPLGLRLLGGLVLAGLISLAAAPTLLPYRRVDQAQAKRPLNPEWGLRPRDVVRATPGSYLYPSLAQDTTPATGERHLFPGFLTAALALVGVFVLLWGSGRPSVHARRRDGPKGGPDPPDRTLFAVLLTAAGAVAVVLAFGATGRNLPTPWRLFYDYVPGFSGVRVTARLAAVTILAGDVLAGIGLAWLLRRLHRPLFRLALTAVLCVGVLLELAGPLFWVVLPHDQATLAVYKALDRAPAGAVAELPMKSSAFIEAPRMVWSTLDFHPRLNGYSGYDSPTYEGDIRILASFPSPAALDLLRQRQVRFVILHVGVQAGYPMYTDGQVKAVIAALPQATPAVGYGSNYLIDLSARLTS